MRCAYVGMYTMYYLIYTNLSRSIGIDLDIVDK